MEIVTTVDELRSHAWRWRTQAGRIALVPTMGNLHAGHLKLVRHARAIAGRVVVSVFVNPAQFGENEDYQGYPVTREHDISALVEADADLLFMPEVSEVYGDGYGETTQVVVPGLNAILEGEFRPTHFDGVTTVVAKLFNMLQPDVAVFGEKDFQQLLIIRRMVNDLNMPVAIESVATVREADGLAMSSRNNYLTSEQRPAALSLYQSLVDAKQRVIEGCRNSSELIEQAQKRINAFPETHIDYISIVDPDSLEDVSTISGPVRMALAVKVGHTRLIDNLLLKP